MNETELYGKAWERWDKKQYIKLIEELSELQKAVCKYMLDQGDREHIAEEIADVQIMLDQMKAHFGVERCEKYRQIKLVRLEKMLEMD